MYAAEQVILVDQHDQEIGVEEKLKAHEEGKLHRAFSVFVLRKKPHGWESLLQRRQYNKYHSAGLWTNSCCSHPRPGEPTIDAAKRRLYEEMGIGCELYPIGKFHYTAHFANGLTENELDHVFVGLYGDEPFTVNYKEVAEFRWVELVALEQELQQNPELFTAWFSQAFQIVKQKIATNALNMLICN